MFSIAQRFGVSLQALIAANPHITDPNRLFPCDVLCVPCPAFVKRSVEDDIEEPGGVYNDSDDEPYDDEEYFDEGYDEGYDEDFDDEEDEADYEVHKDDDGCCDQD